MKFTKIADVRADFWKSVMGARENVQHIERLARQMDIDVRNMEAKGGKVDHDAYSSRILRAIDLRLIDAADARSFSAESAKTVEDAYNFVKRNIRQIQAVADDPFAYQNRLNTTSMRDENKQRRHFCDLFR